MNPYETFWKTIRIHRDRKGTRKKCIVLPAANTFLEAIQITCDHSKFTGVCSRCGFDTSKADPGSVALHALYQLEKLRKKWSRRQPRRKEDAK